MKKRVAIIGIALAALAALGAWWVLRSSASDAPLVLYGNLDVRTAQLAFNGQGLVDAVLVEEGASVTPGQIIARLDDVDLAAQLSEAQAQRDAQRAVVARLQAGSRPQEIEQAKAQVASAQARVNNSQHTVDRYEPLAQQSAISRQQLDDARAQLDVEKAALNEARQSLALVVEGPRREDIDQALAQLSAADARTRQLEKRVADTQLRAPSPGIIQSRLLERGDYATPTRPAFTLALTDPKWVRAYVSEPDLNRVQPNAHCRVTVDTDPDHDISGWVGYISPVAEFTPKSVETTDLRSKLVYEVRVYVHDPENRLRLGTPATVRVDESASPATQP
ncbi:MAG: efflux RND transporter periplasmic adaptor subunit [Tepidisphaeraceae bacterium]